MTHMPGFSTDWGDPNGIAARAFYKRLGFSEGNLTEEFDCPVQEFILKR